MLGAGPEVALLRDVRGDGRVHPGKCGVVEPREAIVGGDAGGDRVAETGCARRGGRRDALDPCEPRGGGVGGTAQRQVAEADVGDPAGGEVVEPEADETLEVVGGLPHSPVAQPRLGVGGNVLLLALDHPRVEPC